jgi:MFS family permease
MKPTRKSHKRISVFLLLGITLVVLSIMAASIAHTFTSDDVAQQNAVASFNLRAPVVIDLPQDTYVMKLPFYAAIAVLPVAPTTRVLITAIILILLGYVLFWLAAKSFVQKSNLAAPSLLPLLWLASLGAGLGSILINPNSRNLEIGLAFVALAMLARWYKGEWRTTGLRGLAVVVVFVILLGLLFYDDPYIAYTFAVPVVLVFGIKWLLLGNDRRALLLCAAMFTAAMCAKGWYWLFWLLGVHAGQGSAIFASMPRAALNAQLFVDGVLNLYNADIFGHSIWGLQTVSLELNFLILIGTLMAPLMLFSRRVRQDTWKVLLLLQPLFMSIIFIGSTMAIDGQSMRYLVLLPFFSALIWAVVVSEHLPPRPRLVVTGAFALAAVLNVASTVQDYRARGDSPNAENIQIARIVESQHLTKGYATFWDAGINQYYTSNKVMFIQSGCSPKAGVGPYRWLLNEQVLRRPASNSFYLLDPATTRCTDADLARFFGRPQQVIRLDGQKQLLIYGYDISMRL